MTIIIDTDSHAVEEPTLWTARMNPKWGEGIPHVKYDAARKSDMWYVGDTAIMHAGFSVIGHDADGGIVRDEASYPAFITVFDEMHPSAWDPVARAKVMDEFGIRAAALYPNLGFVGPDIYRVMPDSPLEYQVEIATTYNDWILEWSQKAPGRFIPLACIPYWDVPSAVKEIERAASMGHRGFVTTGTPQGHGEPVMADPHWDPVWAAVQATGLPISFHAGSGGKSFTSEEAVRRLELEGKKGTLTRQNAVSFLNNGIVAADLLMSGVLPRFPELKFITVESGVGWIPFVLDTLDWHFERYNVRRDRPEYTELPSFYFRRQMYANTWFERLDPWHLENIGVDNMLFETDFPHPTCLIEGEIQQTIDRAFEKIDAESREKILWKNAAKLFGVSIDA